jgi:benzoyl-CoA reductase/2-hydroxyglutaryl-CoA dehydratase subunit BcrC/BadD/HgdB
MHVLLASPWIPPEWVLAHGFESRGIWFDDRFAAGAIVVENGICALAQNSVQLARQNPRVPVIFASHCDQLRRGFDEVSEPGRFLFNLPATWQSAAAQNLYESELRRLGRFLVQLGGSEPTNEAVAQAITLMTTKRKRLLSLAPHTPGKPMCSLLADYYGASLQTESTTPPCATEAIAAGLGTSRPHPIPLALLGSPLTPSQWRLFDTIEAAGGTVALNATENGERSLIVFPDEQPAGDTPTLRLARAYVQGCADVFQRPNTPLYSWLKPRLLERKIRGILLWHYVGCDLWRAEAQSLREAFELPLLTLDATEATSDHARTSGRIQAFLESLQ